MNKRVKWGVLAFAAMGLVIPGSVGAYRYYYDYNQRSVRADFVRAGEGADDPWIYRGPGASDDPLHKVDDVRRRYLYNRFYWGSPNAAYNERLARLARQETERWAELMPRGPVPYAARAGAAPAPGLTGFSWVNLGPTDSEFNYNGVTTYDVDSGRAAGFAVSEADPETVYFATSGGGIWRTHEISAADPRWVPITETIGNLAIGAMEMDPTDPETLYVGLGDFIDLPGGQIIKTTDGGSSWSVPAGLTGSYGGFELSALTIRDIIVSPEDPSVVLIATDVGLFRSADGADSFSLVDLPNAGGESDLPEGLWSLVHVGATGSISHFAVSGTYACAPGERPLPPGAGAAPGQQQLVDGSICVGGSLGDVWVTDDAGLTWSSVREAGGLAETSTIASQLAGRIDLAAASPADDPSETVVYAQVGDVQDAQALAIWRSMDGGASFVSINGTVTNRTDNTDCVNSKVASFQAFYNHAIAVDPGDPDNVIVGGQLCGIRSRNATAEATEVTWQNVGHWLPPGGGRVVGGGTLPYVHADWHESKIMRLADGTIRVFAGTDGGIFVSDDVFDVAAGASATWRDPNRGLVTHLAYSIASLDPATGGDPYVVFTGLQDNGTRIRASEEVGPTTFNQVIGGDGFGAAAVRNPDTGDTFMYGSVNGSRRRCVNNCGQGSSWTTLSSTHMPSCVHPVSGAMADSDPFHIRYAVSLGDHSVLTNTWLGVHRVVGSELVPLHDACFVSPERSHLVRDVDASATVPGLYGAILAGGRFAVSSDCAAPNTDCTWSLSEPLGVDLDGVGGITPEESVFYTASITFPPAAPAGKDEGDVYVVASAATVTEGGTPVSDELGHIFLTEDRGQTWIPLSGSGLDALPNVAVNVVRYDSADPEVLYAGTDLGVYRTTDGGASWHRFGVGLPLVKVTKLFLSKTGGLMRVATYGRGLWEIHPSTMAARGVPGSGDWDHNQQIDFVDLAAMSSRLGTTPASTAQPYYDWNLDLEGAVNEVDDTDLEALLSRFGGQP